ncbi:YCII-related domain-containing protein [Chitinophaga japonensis]|uniref:YCII-related domain-containing protein n=2 Tax=Chitinophaga japonensis TaxID=104662 RepID=A0A562T622_CHIJA|nr:YCII-related domain-containing protein [Chitinophaga japonensis]
MSLCLCCAAASAQTSNPRYDKALADSLGADEYGMKMYVLVMLKTGPKEINNKDTLRSLFRGHMANIQRLADEGKLVVAGPLGKNERSYRGIFIFDVKTIAAASDLLRTDPAIAAGLLDAELFEWYGSAALPVYLEVHEKIEKMQP